jgi:hypothetical protein
MLWPHSQVNHRILAGIVVVRHPIASAVAMPAFLVLLLGIQGVVVGAITPARVATWCALEVPWGISSRWAGMSRSRDTL